MRQVAVFWTTALKYLRHLNKHKMLKDQTPFPSSIILSPNYVDEDLFILIFE